MRREVATPWTRAAGMGMPRCRVVPDSTDRCTAGWGTTSERYAALPRSQRTVQ